MSQDQMETKQTALTKQSEKPCAISALRPDAEKKQIADMITQCFDVLKVYGKEPEQIKNTIKAFILTLAGFSMEQINSAFIAYLSDNSEMPTPSDIVKLIKRGNKPPLEKSVYIALCQKRERTSFFEAGAHGNCLTIDEEQYIRDYEAEMMN